MNHFLEIIYILCLLSLLYWINKKYIQSIPSYVLPLLFLVKLSYSAFFLYIYTYHYGGGELTQDAGVFFKESKVLHEVFHQNPIDYFKFLLGTNNDIDFINTYLESTNHWNSGRTFIFNDSRNVIRTNSLLLFISNNNVFIHFIFLSFASFFGGIELFHWLKNKSKIPPTILLCILLLAPSIAFWSSSNIKEPLMILGLCLFLRGWFDERLTFQRKFWRIFVGFFLMVGFKTYVGILFAPVAMYYLLISPFFQKQWKGFIIFGSSLIIALLLTGFSDKIATTISNQQEDFFNVANGGLYLYGDDEHYFYIPYYSRHNFELERRKALLIKPVKAYKLHKDEKFERTPFLLDKVGKEFDIYLNMNVAGSIVYIPPIQDSFWKMLATSPHALSNSFFQPIPNKESSWLQYPALLETILYIIAAILALIIAPKTIKKKDKRVIATLWLYCIIVGMLIGWTTPVSGAIVRYFIPVQVALLCIFIIKFDYNKFKHQLKKRLT